jgi:D-3-phosphoglycerate dehydrogenase
MIKNNLLYFRGVNLDIKNLILLKKYFRLLNIKNKKEALKLSFNERIKVHVIYCDQQHFLGEDFLSSFTNLKYLVSSTTSTDFIDKIFCIKYGIKIISLENKRFFLKKITPTAEHTLGLILLISRNYYSAISSVKNGIFNRRKFGGYKMLSDCNLGIIGYGRLGKILKKISKNLFSQIFTADIKDKKYFKNNLKKIFKYCDFVTLHIPSKNNYEFFSKTNVPFFSKKFYLINTSRGDVIDEKFLINCLKKKAILGYGTDVIKGEFQKDFSLKNNIIYRNADKYNIIITPHIGGSTRDAWYKTENKVIVDLIKECGY